MSIIINYIINTYLPPTEWNTERMKTSRSLLPSSVLLVFFFAELVVVWEKADWGDWNVSSAQHRSSDCCTGVISIRLLTGFSIAHRGQVSNSRPAGRMLPAGASSAAGWFLNGLAHVDMKVVSIWHQTYNEFDTPDSQQRSRGVLVQLGYHRFAWRPVTLNV